MSKDQYDVLEPLGNGAFGSVWKIRRKADDRILVWKDVDFGRFSQKEKEQLVAEVNILRELKSPFVVKYVDRIIDRSGTRLYIIMEYCSGGDLGKLISKSRRDKTYLDENFIIKMLAQLALALKDCHRRTDDSGASRPILHRDIKPANILLDSSQNVKAADFGLAKELSNHTKYAQTSVGTPLYMAPEIINEKGYDEKTDIWSLGCLIYELAALKPPFEATNAVSLAMKINTGKYPRIPSRYSDALFDAIRSMLSTDPKRRPRIEDILDLPILQNAVYKAKTMVSEYQLQVNVSMKTKELTIREAKIVSKEQELIAKEELLQQREQSITAKESCLLNRENELSLKEKLLKNKEEELFEQKKLFEKDKLSMQSQAMQAQAIQSLGQHIDEDKAIATTAQGPSGLAHKAPKSLQYHEPFSLKQPKNENLTKQPTAGGFHILCDAPQGGNIPTASSVVTSIPSSADVKYPVSKLSVIARNQGVKRVQDMLSYRPLTAKPANIAIAEDKENAIPSSQPVHTLGKRGLRERRDSNIMDENEPGDRSNASENLLSPWKKPRIQKTMPSKMTEDQGGSMLNHVSVELQALVNKVPVRGKFIHMNNFNLDAMHEDQQIPSNTIISNVPVPVITKNNGTIATQNPFQRQRMPPPPPILGYHK